LAGPSASTIGEPEAATYNRAMRNHDRWLAAGLALAVALAMLVPVWAATRLAPNGSTFAGFLINPIDGFSYLAKMREGLEGSWLFTLPYASEAGTGAFLFPYYLALGHLARLLDVDLWVILLAARALGAAFMFLAIFRFLEEFVADRRARWVAYVLCLVGGGWGWLGIPLQFAASDLSIPETTPFLSAYANAHFPIATACFVIAATGVLGCRASRWSRITASLISGAALALVLPFLLLPSVLVFLIGIVVIGLQERRDGRPSSALRRTILFGAFLAGAAPGAIYGVWLLRTRPDLAAWNAQNQTPSPALGAYLLGYAPLLLLAAVAVIADRQQRRIVWLLLAWVIVQSALLYAPLALQRRLSLGLYVPLAALCGIGLAAISRSSWRQAVTILVLVSALPSNAVVIVAGLSGVARAEPLMIQSADESCALRWLAANADPGSLVLAGETTGNRIPAFTSLRVVYGHPFETPHAMEELALVEGLFSRATTLAEALPVLRGRGIDFVYFGPEERALGPAPWPEELTIVCRCGSVAIAKVQAP
jgi:hypothetical protein